MVSRASSEDNVHNIVDFTIMFVCFCKVVFL